MVLRANEKHLRHWLGVVAIYEIAVVLGHISVSHKVKTSVSCGLKSECLVSMWQQRKNTFNAHSGIVTAMRAL